MGGFEIVKGEVVSFNALNIQAAMIDLDGTLVDTLGDFEAALNRMLADLDLPSVTRDWIERSVGKGSEHLIRSVLAHQLALPEVAGLSNVCQSRSVDVLFEPAWQRYQHHYARLNGQFANVYPGVLEGLQHMRKSGWRLACLTNKPLAFAQGLLKAKGLDVYFEHVFGGDSFARKKPDPLPLLQTCQVLGTLPQNTLMVGDSSNDAQAAHAAGCPVVLVTYGYNHGEPIRAVQALDWLDSLALLN
ncbi:MAG: Phosphoglycolate phosphatase, plasmid [Pseudomonadota bacterium]|jgi:phosphoglycolate phosphatase